MDRDKQGGVARAGAIDLAVLDRYLEAA